MTTIGLAASLAQADAAGRRQLLHDLPSTHDPDTLAAIADWLHDDTTAVCEAAVDALTRCGGHGAAEAAARHLGTDDPAQRGYAIDVLVRLGPVAIPTLVGLLNDPDHDRRKYAAESLGVVGDASALTALVEALRDPDVTVAAAAAEALGRLRLPGAVPFLAAVLLNDASDDLDWLWSAAIHSLGEIGGRAALEQICSTPHDAPFPVLAMAIEAASRAAAADPVCAIAFLADLIGKDDQFVTELALTALGAVLDLPIETALPVPMQGIVAQAARRGLQASTSAVRAASARCLRAVRLAGAPSAHANDVAALWELLATDEQAEVRLAALWALVDLGGMTLALLVERAASVIEDGELRRAALRVLATHPELSRERVEASLVPVVTDAEDVLVRVAAFRVLVQAGSTEAPRLGLGVLGDEAVWDSEQALIELLSCPITGRVALVQEALDTAPVSTRRWALTNLLPIGDAAATLTAVGGRELLVRAANHDDWAIRAHAVNLVRGEPAMWARQISHRACTDADPRVRVRALGVLASVPGDADGDRLLHASLADASGWVRVAALEGLMASGQIDHDVLAVALSDSFPAMRRAALEAARLLVERACPVLREEITRVARAAARQDDGEVANLGCELLRRLE